MNISASNLSVQAIVTPQNVGASNPPKLSTPSSIEISTSVPTTESDVSPTYDKPTASNDISKQPEISVEPESSRDENIESDGSSETDKNQGEEPSEIEQSQSNEVYSEAELEQISALKLRDSEVSAHEKAHAAVGGQHAGTPHYSYKTGPDGVKYAVSGEVSIDTSSIPGDPQATLQKAQQIKAAALAPMEPSGQDRKVAAKAEQMAASARSELLAASNGNESNSTTASSNYESSVPEKFSGVNTNSLSVNEELDITTQQKMNERSFHINHLYQSSGKVSEPSRLDIQI